MQQIEDAKLDWTEPRQACDHVEEGFFMKEKNPLNLFSKSLYPHYNEIGYNKVSSTVFKLIK